MIIKHVHCACAVVVVHVQAYVLPVQADSVRCHLPTPSARTGLCVVVVTSRQ